MANIAPVAQIIGAAIPLKSKYEAIGEHGIGSNVKDNERLNFGSLSRASRYSNARNNKGREPTPLTPEILHLLDKQEPVKGQHARVPMEHTTR
jgi:hypothetical protein